MLYPLSYEGGIGGKPTGSRSLGRVVGAAELDQVAVAGSRSRLGIVLANPGGQSCGYFEP